MSFGTPLKHEFFSFDELEQLIGLCSLFHLEMKANQEKKGGVGNVIGVIA